MKRLFLKYLAPSIVIAVMLFITVMATIAPQNSDGSRTFDGKSPIYSEELENAYCKTKESNNKAISALSGIDTPQDSLSGCTPTDLPQMGSLVYYSVDVSSPTAFYNNVNGKGFNEGYGYQCVAGFKEFMYALSGKYVAASNGGAKSYANQQAQIEPLGFTWHSGTDGLQNGDWAIWTSGQYGHVSMFYDGKWFGQNQYAANPNAGNPFNLASISNNGIAGYYRPNIYIAQEKPTPIEPIAPTTPMVEDISYTVQNGDTLGAIAISQGWWDKSLELYGDAGYAQRLAEYNKIINRGLIYKNMVIRKI